MALTDIQRVSPVSDGLDVICECGEKMHAMRFWQIDSGQDTTALGWFYWTCEDGHITAALPVPPLP